MRFALVRPSRRFETMRRRGSDRLALGLKSLLDHAEKAGMTLAFEPEPGMFIDTLDRFSSSTSGSITRSFNSRSTWVMSIA